MNDLFSQLEIVPIHRLMSSVQLKSLIKPLQKPYTALCLKEIDWEQSKAALLKAQSELTPSTGFCFFGSYFLSGCVRDDFDFGSVLLFKTEVLKALALRLTVSTYAAFYQLWLEAKLGYEIHPVEETEDAKICTIEPDASAKTTHFDYVDPRNRDVQVEMELVFLRYLKELGALLKTNLHKVAFVDEGFPVEASVIIPVKNRVRTIADALKSALKQQTDRAYNILVVDNHSTDGTTEAIAAIAQEDSRVIHIIPETDDLQIGGCWNLAANNPRCGKFSIQLDSDDVYSNDFVLQTILDAFYHKNCGMVVGAYTLTDINLKIIPPGLIDHQEWTDKNGANNLLRVNGIGAPRAFYTPLLRKHPAPNVSYGEDYALALVFSRLYKVGRIYESLYFCRRWEDNTDANPDPQLKITQNRYKDGLRGEEIKMRIDFNLAGRI